MGNLIDKFVQLLPKLQAIQVMGLAKILKINVMEKINEQNLKESQPRQAQDILQDMICQFGLLGRKQKREIIKVMKQTIKSRKNKKGDLNNGPSTENREEE